MTETADLDEQPEAGAAPEAGADAHPLLATVALPALEPNGTTVTVRLRGEAYKRIRAEARRLNAKQGTVLRECALEYLRLRDDHIAVGAEGSAVAQMLTDSERRTAATIGRLERRIENMSGQQAVLVAAFNAFLKVFLSCVPAPAPEKRDEALAEADTRYARLVAGVGAHLDGETPTLVLEVLKTLERPA